MNFPNAKVLKRLALTCRKVGISHFKHFQDGSFEFTLDPSTTFEPTKQQKTESKQIDSTTHSPFASDTLTDEQLLMWSVTDPTQATEDKKPQ